MVSLLRERVGLQPDVVVATGERQFTRIDA
jgi:hypothetical protein